MPIINPKDLVAQGDPETVVYLEGNGTLLGLYIRGVAGQSMLGIREDAEGHPVSCAITADLHIDTSRWHSNPRRSFWDDDERSL